MLWLIFLLYWFVAARKRKTIKQHQPYGERLVQIVLMALAYALMFNDLSGRGWKGTN